MTKTYGYKQYSVEDWMEDIKASPTGLKRNYENILIKQKGGHPLSTSEQNLLKAKLMLEAKCNFCGNTKQNPYCLHPSPCPKCGQQRGDK